MKIDIDNALVNLKFCPCRIVMEDGRSILGSRCWNWITDKIRTKPQYKKAFEKAKLVNITEGNMTELTVWDMENEEFVTLQIEDIKSCNLDKYKGQMYLE